MTEYGKTLQPVSETMCHWGVKHWQRQALADPTSENPSTVLR
ncbi:MAG: hypothetical protein HC838_08670 [Spirulinaceae cyanobacterium RM2_2_10]|nr:hypothetical protein [Spirulinaceae cyanobacterium SM2_1_0]NJO20102.1 hypothetical protein [Spirulinaceae cyanobacterium RM2_2_10]